MRELETKNFLYNYLYIIQKKANPPILGIACRFNPLYTCAMLHIYSTEKLGHIFGWNMYTRKYKNNLASSFSSIDLFHLEEETVTNG